MWQCAFVSLIIFIIIWFFSYSLFRFDDFNSKTSIELNIVENDEDFLMKNDSEIFKAKRKVKQHIPKFMLELYEKSKKEHLKTVPDIVKSVIPAYQGSHYPYRLNNDIGNNQHMLVFNVPNSNKDEIFLRAELQVLTLIELKSKLALGIEREIKISLYNQTTKELKMLEEKHIHHTENTWISFNVSHAIKKILQSEEKILKLIITVKLYQPFINNNTGTLKLSLMPLAENFEHNYPVLLLFYANAKTDLTNKSTNTIVDKENHRVKRYVDEDYEEESNRIWEDDVNKAMNRKIRRMKNNCRRKPLYVDFAEIHYDSWIVQPSGYEAYQCAGKCFYPVAEHLSPTKHAIVQALLHSVSPARAPRSCCVPTKLDSISVLYVDAQGVLTYRYAYKDMVVTECGCRVGVLNSCDAMEHRLRTGSSEQRRSQSRKSRNPYLIFLKQFTRGIREKSVKEIAKEAAAKWRLMSQNERRQYNLQRDACKRKRKSKIKCSGGKRRKRSKSKKCKCGKKKKKRGCSKKKGKKRFKLGPLPIVCNK